MRKTSTFRLRNLLVEVSHIFQTISKNQYYHAIIHYQKLQGISSGLKWLNYKSFITNKILKNSDDIKNVKINFYTAVNTYLPAESQCRHEIYIEALKRSGVKTTRGFFKLREVGLNCHVNCPCFNTPVFVNNFEISRKGSLNCRNNKCQQLLDLSLCKKIKVPEEKKTDVNLAINIVIDAEKNNFDKFVLFSTDSDFVPTAEYVIKECKKEFVVVAPATKEFVRTEVDKNGQHKPVSDYRYKVNGFEKIGAIIERVRLGQFSHYQFSNPYECLCKPLNW